ncbi:MULTISPECIES: FtsX-like permease family protein [unclassified Streptomyces]|uniref:ABC transporter permease n=1 Tax=unclassified Streptomyces TaxID=2593676 RepID=UPI002DDC7DFB|nr:MULTISPECIES: FtsX-like permease family protein [unclassified Streptomyces]WSA95421.1 ABC transporter permease [Streptomyces sp. NBC_01795]WSS11955.1 ABC transporter permease [Streptomyces sp. NBC_01186]WSS40669.1 ABC transporter permease [Streptomyces sp. NBC_01187]
MISLATVRERWASFLGSFVAVALGVAVVTMSALILLSGGTGVPERLAGAPVLVRAPAGEQAGAQFAENPPWAPTRAKELRQKLAGLPGVRSAVADRSFYAQLPGIKQGAGERQGHGWSSAALASYGLHEGQEPSARDDIVLDRALGHGPGDRITVLTAGGPQRFTVSGTLKGPGYYVTDACATDLTGGIRVIGLTLEQGASAPAVASAAERAVSAAGGGGEVLIGEDRDKLAPRQDEMTRWIGAQVLTAMAALSAFVTVFIVSSAFAFTVAQRRREFGLLRTIGATPKQLRRMVCAEALTVGALGAAVGALAGLALAPSAARVLVDAGLQPDGFAVQARWWVPCVALLLGAAVALAGAWSASRRAARVAPLEAMREAAVDERPMTRRRWISGLAAITAGVGCAVGTAFSGSDTMVLLGLGTAMGLTTGLTLLIPALVRPVVGALARPLGSRKGATALLVRENMRTAVRRTSATIAPVLATVTFAVLITSTVQTTETADTDRQAASVHASAALAPQGTPGLTDAATAGSGLQENALLSTTVYGGSRRSPLTAAGVSSGFQRLYGHPAPHAGTVVVTKAVAAAHGWSQGHRAVLTFEDGRRERLRVAAVLSDEAVPYQLVLPRALVRTHDPSALADVAYRTTGDTPVRPVGGLGAHEVRVETYAASAEAEEDRLVWIFTLMLVAMTAGYTAIAVASTLLTATADRAGDLRILRLSGATSRQVLRAVAGETVCAVVLGAVLGMVVVIPALLGMVQGLRENLGVPVEATVAWPWVVGAVGGCLVLGLAASVLPAHTLLRGPTGRRRSARVG